MKKSKEFTLGVLSVPIPVFMRMTPEGYWTPQFLTAVVFNGFIDGKGYGNRWNYCRELTEEEFMEYSEEGHAKSE